MESSKRPEIGKYYKDHEDEDIIYISGTGETTLGDFCFTFDIVDDPKGIWAVNSHEMSESVLNECYELLHAYNTPLWKVLNG